MPGRRPGNGTRPRAFLGDTRGGMACGVCGVTPQLDQRTVSFPCGQERHALHARCVVEALARIAASAPLRCSKANCGAQHSRWDELEAAVKQIRVSATGSGGWEVGP